MELRIFKYSLAITDRQTVRMPIDAMILSVADQRGTLCLWAQVEVSDKMESRDIEIIGTGDQLYQDMGVSRTFIGTVVMERFVWHVFERN